MSNEHGLSVPGDLKGAAEAVKAVDHLAQTLSVDKVARNALPVWGNVIGATGLLVLRPLESLVRATDQVCTWIDIKVEEKLKGVPAEKRIEADPLVAAPAVQGLMQAFKHEDLRDAFANLLAAAVNKDTADEVMPSFATILKELAPDEAKILRWSFRSGEGIAVVHVYARHGIPKDNELIATNISTVGLKAGCVSQKLLPAYIDHLAGLELFNIGPADDFSRQPEFEGIGKFPAFLEASQKAKAKSGMVDVNRQLMRLSDFGEAFCRICIGPAPDSPTT